MLGTRFIPGQVVRIECTLTDAAGNKIDPGALRLTIKPPGINAALIEFDSSIDSGAFVKRSTGEYFHDYPLPINATDGAWNYRWDLLAPNAGAAEGVFEVKKSKVLS